jgi:glutathione S-transferase
MSKAYRLITMGPSHFCEKARWALLRARVPFVEEPHMPLLHGLHVRRAGGSHSVPVLVTDSGVLADSTEIVELADRHVSGALYGTGAVRRQAKELEERFDERLGPDTRRLVYFHLLSERDKVLSAFGTGVGRTERVLARALYPLTAGLMRRGLRITREATERSRRRIDETFAFIGERLSDGRSHLTGDTFTVADLTFAALGAPALLPPEYGAALPEIDAMPSAYAEVVRGYRETTAGKFLLRLYERERDRVLPVASN